MHVELFLRIISVLGYALYDYAPVISYIILIILITAT